MPKFFFFAVYKIVTTWLIFYPNVIFMWAWWETEYDDMTFLNPSFPKYAEKAGYVYVCLAFDWSWNVSRLGSICGPDFAIKLMQKVTPKGGSASTTTNIQAS